MEDPKKHTVHAEEGIVLEPDGGTRRVDLESLEAVYDALRIAPEVEILETVLTSEPHPISMFWVEHSPEAVNENRIASHLAGRPYGGARKGAMAPIYGPVIFGSAADPATKDTRVVFSGLDDDSRGTLFSYLARTRSLLPKNPMISTDPDYVPPAPEPES